MGIPRSQYFHPNTKRDRSEQIRSFYYWGSSRDGSSFAYTYILSQNGEESRQFVVVGTLENGSFYFVKYDSEDEFRKASEDW